jgi:hypothetical protein
VDRRYSIPNDAARYRPADATHRFKSGESVISSSPTVPPGPYVIVRLLPLVHGEPHYRVKSTVDKHDRALLEGQIRLISREPEKKEPACPTTQH